jgi:hypothetical protein
VDTVRRKMRWAGTAKKKKTQQGFQRSANLLLYNDTLATTGTTVVVVFVVVKRCRVQAGVRQQGARGVVPVCVSAPLQR